MAIDALVEAVARAVPGSEPQTYEMANGHGILVGAGQLVEVLTFLRDDPSTSFDMLVDVTAVDYEASDGVIDVIYSLRSFKHGRRAWVKVKVDAAEPSLPSASALWKSANWAEREVWDMFGVRFEGHPDLRRILLYEEFEGHPLRKSYPYQKRQPLIEERDPIRDPWPGRG